LRQAVQTFDYRGVTLFDSRLKLQFDEVRDFYLRLPTDDILRGYYVRAGLPAAGTDLGGGYLGHNTFGQILSGLARMFSATGDAACKEKAEALQRGWAQCLGADGFFFIQSDPPLPHYSYDKMVCGLVDLFLYCGNRDALGYLDRITDWAIAHLDRTRLFARPTGVGGGEWYTLSENLYRAYQATGDVKYRDFAEVWEYREFWDLIENKADIFQHPLNGGWYHAYSHVNSLCGLGAAYGVKGDARYLYTLKKGFDFLWNTQLFVTGGYGPNETLMPRGKLAGMLRETGDHFETQCGSWAAFKLCKYLIVFTGDARYGDWVELLALNGVGAGIPMDADGGVFYYSDYHLGGGSKENTAPWSCCSGTRLQSLADLHDLIYFKDEQSLYVNLFVPSSAEWQCVESSDCCVNVKVRQVTRFPESADSELQVCADRPVEFALKVRVPGWLSGPMTARINGVPTKVDVDGHGWAVFRRQWKTGDRLLITLPAALRVSRLLEDSEFPAAITHGPVAMAARAPKGNPWSALDFADIAGCLEPVDGSPLNYRAKLARDVLVRPFYEMKKGERYFLYFDPSWPFVRQRAGAPALSRGWMEFSGGHATDVVGATARYAFSGDGLSIQGELYDNGGRMEVKIDGKAVGVINQYGPSPGARRCWTYGGLGGGQHSVVFTVLREKAGESKGHFVNVTGLDCFEREPACLRVRVEEAGG